MKNKTLLSQNENNNKTKGNQNLFKNLRASRIPTNKTKTVWWKMNHWLTLIRVTYFNHTTSPIAVRHITTMNWLLIVHTYIHTYICAYGYTSIICVRGICDHIMCIVLFERERLKLCWVIHRPIFVLLTGLLRLFWISGMNKDVHENLKM